MAFYDSAGTVSKVSGLAGGTSFTNNLATNPNGPQRISEKSFVLTGNGISTYDIFIHYTADAEL